MKRILVTGSNGQLGQCLQKVKKKYPKTDFIFMTSSELDITNKEEIKINFSKFNPDYCINCAAYTNVDRAEEEPEKAFAVNAKGVRHIAEICKEFDTTLIHISTDYVFDGEKKEPYTVTDKPNPINEYGKSKLKGEQYIQEILNQYFIVRTSWLYSEFGKNFYKTILRKAQKEDIIYVSDEQTGCPTDANNLAKFILSLIGKEKGIFGIYHFTDNDVMTWFDFAKKIVRENNLNCIVKARKYNTFASRPASSILI